MVEYSDTILTQGIQVPFDPQIITPDIERPMRNQRYEAGEAAGLRQALRPGDRVLELGSGIGFCSTIAALVPGVEKVVTVEANPELLPMIRETHRINQTTHVDLRNGVVVAGSGQAKVPFYLRRSFWASSMSAGPQLYESMVELPTYGLDDLLHEVRPTVLVCDIEGGEFGLFDKADLSSLRHLTIEFHPRVYGTEGMTQIQTVLAAKGFYPVDVARPGAKVRQFVRQTESVKPAASSLMPERNYQPWLPAKPRILLATCMKDEGPFILEWIAWHKALGVTDFVVFTNDCSDGTNLILDHLDRMGVLQHLPNPALATESTFYQPAALKYLHHLRAFREADFVISSDVDEFIHVRTGQGTLHDLFEKTGPFDALSITEINHGSNRQMHFQPGWVTEQFPLHQSERPGKIKSRRGVKTITRLTPIVEQIRNHRPDFVQDGPQPVWLDGSGRTLETLRLDRSENGLDCRGTYDLVSLEHYSLRSLDSYLMKMLRGDVVVKNKQVSRTYWRTRNRNEETNPHLAQLIPKAKALHDALFAQDPVLMDLHQKACAHHLARIKTLPDMPEFAERRAWILAECW